MLRPEEFRVGDLAAVARDSMTLVLPRSDYEHAAVFGDAFDQRYGIMLGGDLPFQAYPVKPDEPWSGILIVGLRIEVNEKTAYNPAHALETGSIIREADRLNVAAVSGPHPHVGRPMIITLLRGLPQCEPTKVRDFANGASSSANVMTRASCYPLAPLRLRNSARPPCNRGDRFDCAGGIHNSLATH